LLYQKAKKMKITLTGSLGHIGKPLTASLVQKGHSITVISSNPDKQKDIEALGAIAAIGSLEDADFLTAAFTGSDAVYTMIPPPHSFTPAFNFMTYYREITNNFVQAIQQSGVRRVVHLSSIGAHMEKGSGLILGHHETEVTLNQLSDVDITFMRPVGFYYNLFVFIPAIKNAGVISANYGADENLAWVSPIDIAAAVAGELEGPISHRKVLYVASDELTGHETASILGAAIGKPDLKWVLVSDQERQRALEAAGLSPEFAAGLVEMFSAQRSGKLMEDYYRHKPALGKVKLTDFAKEFAILYKQ
jgi:uncharacterized protein YbjT (DUF2867 family)